MVERAHLDRPRLRAGIAALQDGADIVKIRPGSFQFRKFPRQIEPIRRKGSLKQPHRARVALPQSVSQNAVEGRQPVPAPASSSGCSAFPGT